MGSFGDSDRVRVATQIETHHAAQQLNILYGAGAPAKAGIRIFTSHRDQVTTIYVHDPDGVAADAFRVALDHGMHAGEPLLVVDLGGVSSLDAAGLEVLAAAGALAARRGKRISVRRANPAVHQAFVVAGLVASLDVHPARETSRDPMERGAS